MDLNQYKEKWLEEENAAFQGWDFSHIDDRCKEEPMYWDYKDIIEEYREDNFRLLDMGTGGGEFLLSLNHPYKNTWVTESFEPNIALCKKTLEPLGIVVVPVDENGFVNGKYPFDDDSFDFIINRHSPYDLAEVKRVLRPNGFFVTQQVGEFDGVELSKRIIEGYEHPCPDFFLGSELPKFHFKDFHVLDCEESYPIKRYFDVGAIVYYAKAVPWEFPGFSVETHFEQLCDLQREIEEKGYIESYQHRFVISAINEK